jgi:hypothetical protein
MQTLTLLCTLGVASAYVTSPMLLGKGQVRTMVQTVSSEFTELTGKIFRKKLSKPPWAADDCTELKQTATGLYQQGACVMEFG